MEKIKSMYAIPCVTTMYEDDFDLDPDDVFFITLNTRNEDEALKLASCVCGKKRAANALVIINENGQVFPLF